MIKTSLFAADEREAKLDKLGDILQDISGMVDFAGLAGKIDAAAPRAGDLAGPGPAPARAAYSSLAVAAWVALRFSAASGGSPSSRSCSAMASALRALSRTFSSPLIFR